MGGAIKVQKQWKQSGLLGKRKRFENLNGVPIRTASGELKIIVPTDATQFPEKAVDGSESLIVASSSGDQSMEDPAEKITATAVDGLGYIAWPSLKNVTWLDASDFRTPQQQETVLAVRANVGDSDITYLHYPIEGSYIRSDWTLPHFDGDPELWHGTPVLSAEDGKIVGILLVKQREPRIVPFEASLLSSQ